MTKATELYRIDEATIIRFTNLAVLISVNDEEMWLPFSQIFDPDDLEVRASRGLTIELAIPAWLAKEKGLI